MPFLCVSFSYHFRVHCGTSLVNFRVLLLCLLSICSNRKRERGEEGRGGGEWRGSGLAEGTSACLELRDAWTKGREVQRDTGVDDQRKEGRRGKREL